MPPLNVIPVTDLCDPRLAPYRNQKDAWLRASHNPRHAAGASPGGARATPAGEAGDGLFMAEGLLVVQALLRSRYRVHSILGTPERVALIHADVLVHAPDTPVFTAPPTLLEQIVGFDLHRGLLAAGHRVPAAAPAALLDDVRTLVIAEDLSNHDNVGGLFRTVAALGRGPGEGGDGGAGVLLSPRCCDPLYRKALRVSMGHALCLPFAVAPDWPGVLTDVAEAGFRIVALLTPVDGGAPRDERAGAHLRAAPDPAGLSRSDRLAVLVGAEGPGLSPEVVTLLGALASDGGGPPPTRLSIPMAPGVDSLNVVVALAIALDRLRGRGPAPRPHAGPRDLSGI